VRQFVRKVDLSSVRIIDCTLAGMTIDGVLVTIFSTLERERG